MEKEKPQIRVTKEKPDYRVEFLNDGSWWIAGAHWDKERLLKNHPLAKTAKQGNGNKARLVSSVVTTTEELLDEHPKKEKS